MPNVNKILIDKYLRGECTSEEEQDVIDWLEDNDLEAYEDRLNKKKADKRIEKKWKEMTTRFHELDVASPHSIRRINKRWLAAAVSIGIIFLAGLVSLWVVSQKDGQRYVTGFGEVKSIILPDGTSVTLDAKSTLVLSEEFNKGNRKVALSGQAFFTVTKDAGNPFIVQTDQLDVKVLGTSFGVSAFERDADISVALKEGKVLVKSEYLKREYNKGVLLKPGEEVVFEKQTANLILKRYNKKEKKSWMRQDIYFHNAGIEEVLHKLHRFYGVSFDAEGLKKDDWQLSGEYRNQTLREVLESLSFNYDLRYKIAGKKVILYEKR